jgi:hypothetical protein
VWKATTLTNDMPGTMPIPQSNVTWWVLCGEIKPCFCSVELARTEGHRTVHTHRGYPTTPEFKSLVEQEGRAWRRISQVGCVLQHDLPRPDDSSVLDSEVVEVEETVDHLLSGLAVV